MGQPMEHVLRQCLISLRLAQRLGLGQLPQLSVPGEAARGHLAASVTAAGVPVT
jgi:hypothetical protein